MRRERMSQLSFAKMLAGFLAPISGMDRTSVTKLLAEYGEELTHLRYNYKYESFEKRLRKKKIAKKTEEMRLLDKVAAMTVKEDA